MFVDPVIIFSGSNFDNRNFLHRIMKFILFLQEIVQQKKRNMINEFVHFTLEKGVMSLWKRVRRKGVLSMSKEEEKEMDKRGKSNEDGRSQNSRSARKHTKNIVFSK